MGALRRLCFGLFFLLSFSHTKAQLQCDNDTSGLKSLIDLQYGKYLGFKGGLYPDGSNIMPYPHFADGMNISRQVVPLDADGNLDLLEGKAGFICLGASTAGNAFNHFKTVADLDPEINPCLKIVNAALGAKGLEIMTDTIANAWYWDDDILVDLENSNLSRYQVQIIWIMVTSRVDTLLYWPYQPRRITDRYEELMPILLAKFPNLKQVYASGFNYGGYADPTHEFFNMINEPASYWNNWSIKFLIERQINGDPGLKYAGVDRKAPWIAWGPHLWADGMRKNYVDGLFWNCTADYKPDGGGYHLSNDGKDKEGNLIYDFFRNSIVAADWFLYNPRWTSCDPDFRTSELKNTDKPEIKVFPNPNNGIGYFEIQHLEAGKLEILIENALGQLVYTYNTQVENDYIIVPLSLENNAKGIYNIVFQNNNTRNSISFILQ